MAFPDAWEEVVLVDIALFDASSPVNKEFAAITETIDIGEPDYPGESIPNLAGGRIWKQSPQEDGEVTLEIYPISLDQATANQGLFQWFNGGTIDASQPLATDIAWAAGVSRTRERFRITLLWTDDVAVSSAVAATSTTGSVALRFSAMGCRITSHKSAYTDGILKTTPVFKFPAMNKAGDVKMYRWDSTSAGGSGETPLVALTAYDDEDSWT